MHQSTYANKNMIIKIAKKTILLLVRNTLKSIYNWVVTGTAVNESAIDREVASQG